MLLGRGLSDGLIPAEHQMTYASLSRKANELVELNITIIHIVLYITMQKYSAVSTKATIDMVVSKGHALSEEARLVYGVGV